MKISNHWKITCNHTPEVIDRVLMPIRKRGMSVESLNYQREEDKGICTISFAAEENDATRIFKNMIRVTDILKIETN